MHGTGAALHKANLGAHVFGFYAVSAHILHGRSAHIAGDEGEVLQSAPAVLQRPQDKGVPRFAGRSFHHHGVVGLAHHLLAQKVDVQHGSGQAFLGEEQVTAAAQYQGKGIVGRNGAHGIAYVFFRGSR